MELEKIRESLNSKFNIETSYEQGRHIVFWYDEVGAFKDIIDELHLSNAKVLKITKGEKRGKEFFNNYFKIKYTIEVIDKESNFLIYSEHPRPNDAENYILDLELCSEEFHADQSMMIIDEYKLDPTNSEIRKYIRSNINFFNNKERRIKFESFITVDKSLHAIRLAMLGAVVKSADSSITNILKTILIDGIEENSKIVEIEKWLDLSLLDEELEKEYAFNYEEIKKFFYSLVIKHFYYSLRESNIPAQLKNYYVGNNNAYLFVDSWINDSRSNEKYKELALMAERELELKKYLVNIPTERLVTATTFRVIDDIVIYKILELLNSGITEYDNYKEWINTREDLTPWKSEYINIYNTLFHACEMLKIEKEFLIKSRDIKSLFEEYCKNYSKIDYTYRKFYLAYDKAVLSTDLNLEPLREKIEKFYTKNYLKSINEVWIEKLKENDNEWNNFGLNYQKDFYRDEIIKMKDRIVVIISDAFRYEVAAELRERIMKELKSSSVSLEAMLGVLPSYTKLGMASLLPHSNEIDYSNGDIFVGNINSAGTENRDKILKLARESSVALQYKDILNREKLRELSKGKEIIYVYHDCIDATGDKKSTERDVFNACERAIDELLSAIKYLSNNISAKNIYITADHGFLYEREELEEYDKVSLDTETSERNRRFLISDKRIEPQGTVTIDLKGTLKGMYGVFPNGNYRFKVAGGGANYVHGGLSPQEVVIPLLKYKISVGNIIQKKKVDIKLSNLSRKITNNTTKFNLFQLDAIDLNKSILPRSVKLGIYKDDILISDEKNILFKSEVENDEYSEYLTLKKSNYNKNEICHLRIIDAENNDIIEEIEYKIDISISNDFGF